MSKYYDLDKLKGLIEAKAETLIGDGAIAFYAVAKWLDFLPAADVAPVVHGHWVKYGVDIAEHPLHCSVCGWSSHHISNKEVETFGFCPNPKCGAKMDEEIKK